MIDIKQIKSDISGPLLFQGPNNILRSTDLTWDDDVKMFTVNGAIKMVDGNEGLDKVFVSDANGVASWQILTPSIIVTPPATQYVGSLTGTNAYTGVTVPTFSGSYVTGVLYLLDFDNANTAGVTINLNTVGVVDVLKYDETGTAIPLELGDITPSITYFFVWNGTFMEYYDTEPLSVPYTYTNLNPVPTTIGGIASGSTFNATTMSQMFDMLLYPYISAVFNSFTISGQAGTLEVGNSITAGSKVFNWTLSNTAVITTSLSIKNLNTGVVLVSGLNPLSLTTTQTISAVTFTTPSTYTWQVKATRTNSSVFTRNFQVVWRHRMFYGVSSNLTLTDIQAVALTNVFPATVPGGTFTYTGAGYKYFIIPDGFSNPALFRDFDTNLNIVMADADDGYTDTNAGAYNFSYLTIVNAYSVTITYRVYRTKNFLNGNIKITVS